MQIAWMRAAAGAAATTLFIVTTAHADDRGVYLNATAGAFAGAGIEGLTVTALGSEIASGYRISPLFSIEGLFTGWFQTQASRLPEEGAACSGNYTDQWHWQTFGARLWAHVAHGERVDLAIAPQWLAGGVAYTHGRSLIASGSSDSCFRPPTSRDSSGAIIVFGLIAFALELKLDKRFALRIAAGVEIDLAQDAGFGVLALTGSVGPAFHF